MGLFLPVMQEFSSRPSRTWWIHCPHQSRIGPHKLHWVLHPYLNMELQMMWGGFRTGLLHASPAPSRSVPAASVTSNASYGRTHGEQELPSQTITNDVIQARTSRISMSGTTALIPMRVTQDQFHFRSPRVDSPPSATIPASMEHRRYAENFEDSPAVSTSQRTHAYQGQRQATRYTVSPPIPNLVALATDQHRH
jgi:hypothetical protein